MVTQSKKKGGRKPTERTMRDIANFAKEEKKGQENKWQHSCALLLPAQTSVMRDLSVPCVVLLNERTVPFSSALSEAQETLL